MARTVCVVFPTVLTIFLVTLVVLGFMNIGPLAAYIALDFGSSNVKPIEGTVIDTTHYYKYNKSRTPWTTVETTPNYYSRFGRRHKYHNYTRNVTISLNNTTRYGRNDTYFKSNTRPYYINNFDYVNKTIIGTIPIEVSRRPGHEKEWVPYSYANNTTAKPLSKYYSDDDNTSTFITPRTYNYSDVYTKPISPRTYNYSDVYTKPVSPRTYNYSDNYTKPVSPRAYNYSDVYTKPVSPRTYNYSDNYTKPVSPRAYNYSDVYTKPISPRTYNYSEVYTSDVTPGRYNYSVVYIPDTPAESYKHGADVSTAYGSGYPKYARNPFVNVSTNASVAKPKAVTVTYHSNESKPTPSNKNRPTSTFYEENKYYIGGSKSVNYPMDYAVAKSKSTPSGDRAVLAPSYNGTYTKPIDKTAPSPREYGKDIGTSANTKTPIEYAYAVPKKISTPDSGTVAVPNFHINNKGTVSNVYVEKPNMMTDNKTMDNGTVPVKPDYNVWNTHKKRNENAPMHVASRPVEAKPTNSNGTRSVKYDDGWSTTYGLDGKTGDSPSIWATNKRYENATVPGTSAGRPVEAKPTNSNGTRSVKYDDGWSTTYGLDDKTGDSPSIWATNKRYENATVPGTSAGRPVEAKPTNSNGTRSVKYDDGWSTTYGLDGKTGDSPSIWATNKRYENATVPGTSAGRPVEAKPTNSNGTRSVKYDDGWSTTYGLDGKTGDSPSIWATNKRYENATVPGTSAGRPVEAKPEPTKSNGTRSARYNNGWKTYGRD
ncbi:uncharacterized protein LOC111348002 [Spodoptera litura]|uniref:Uncharacterized protein LOC111348002 n=1 Tax=Spodoptera litura TaxID=69820 RepID=A0A9J7IIH1_SPOLT|nr:uncharacterized protein LOC111348002 [Spodoptera litura]